MYHCPAASASHRRDAEAGRLKREIASDGTLYLDWLTWGGAPRVIFARPPQRGIMWQRAWVSSLDYGKRGILEDWYPEPFRLIQNQGRGMISTGTRDWIDYRVSAPVTPHRCQATGIAARVQGLRRYYALRLRQGDKAQLVKLLDSETVLAEVDFPWQFGSRYELSLQVQGSRLTASINGVVVFDLEDTDHPLTGGAIALICEQGRVGCEQVTVEPVS